MDLAGKRITVVGLAREGTALVRFLVARGADVTISDHKPATALQEYLSRIGELPVRLSVGANRVEDTIGADMVLVSPGVPRQLPCLVAAREHGVPVSSETRLFFELCPAPIVGVTGSNGKTTTTTLVGEILRAAGRQVFVGGNIGLPLIDQLDLITAESWVVLELSSFQLELMNASPHVAAITNVTPNHLDRHVTLEAYFDAKLNIVRHQKPDDVAVLNWDDRLSREAAAHSPGRVVFHSQTTGLDEGVCLDGQWIVARCNGDAQRVLSITDLKLLGRHNVENSLCATGLALGAGAGIEAVTSVLSCFTGVEHRLEPVAEQNGVRFYNDSIATSPERTIAALEALPGPLIVLMGGRSKHLSLEGLADVALRTCKAVIAFGEAGAELEQAISTAKRTRGVDAPLTRRVGPLDEALEEARRLAQPGDAVVLSPACTSFDAFVDFEERGQAFKRLVLDQA
ncbi:MAG: UDP-N-acetylmuramoyl-L-alanine--D-glutamate ligase [Chloroflexota bacterium]|nr:MAG: UDP-N-acetylmuramoyl-L-alanine--D-glutamate ligase [Chloroflexota bacterium]